MTLNGLKNKKIALLGLGVENYALLKFLLAKKINCQITVCDQRTAEYLGEKFIKLNKQANIFWQLGKNFKNNLNRYNILFRSPGWPLFCLGIQQAAKKNKKIIVTSPMQLFFDLCPTKNIIGVTGTKGKGTTASLIYQILLNDKKRVWLGGNIGVAPFDFINKLKPNSWVVLELSSFQLEDLKTSPHIAVLTNFNREHLSPADPNNPNYHANIKKYLEAKLNIAKWQKKTNYFVVNYKLQKNHKKITNSKLPAPTAAKIAFFAKSALPSKLVGEHNKENIAAAEAVAKIVGIKPEIIAKTVKNFKGLEHRLEFVREIKGAHYYDDSFATTPESAIIALESFNSPIILLAGGADKGANFKNFAEKITQRVKFVCLLRGQATPKIKGELDKLKFTNYKIFNNLKTAVHVAKKTAQAGDVILLSTACASFGLFINYKERGDLFKAMVKKL